MNHPRYVGVREESRLVPLQSGRSTERRLKLVGLDEAPLPCHVDFACQEAGGFSTPSNLTIISATTTPRGQRLPRSNPKSPTGRSMPAVLSSLSSRASSDYVAFVDGPDGRGTVGLVWSCLLTLALCVWSALHLNIPWKHDTQINHWSRVLRRVLLGILAPELVLWAA